MLSRVADRLYWLARYLERAENTARLVNAYSQLILDVPRGLEPGWPILIATIDAEAAFQRRYAVLNERNVVKFLLVDADNDGSIAASVAMARENMRTSRDVMPGQAWEQINELHLLVRARAKGAVSRGGRFEFLEGVISHCQQLHGLVETSVLRDHGLWFLRLGRLIERADMTSRIVDVGAAAIDSRSRDGQTEIPLLWANLLKSLSATAAYRRTVGPELTADDVVEFVFREARFPRSLAYCLSSASTQLELLNAPKALIDAFDALALQVADLCAADLDFHGLHEFIDGFQGDLAALHAAAQAHWFTRSDG